MRDGFSTDYAHVDPLLGTRAKGEVYPVISDWLAAEAS